MNTKYSYTGRMHTPLIVALDVDYRDTVGIAAGIWFRGWESDVTVEQRVNVCQNIAPYVPGAFYQRELPCLLEVLAGGPVPDFIIVDGYVWIDEGKMGLGAHLAASVNCEVLGVAKTHYAGAPACEVLRGTSTRPLYVTASTMDPIIAGKFISSMHGGNRLPTILKLVDRVARDQVWQTVPPV